MARVPSSGLGVSLWDRFSFLGRGGGLGSSGVSLVVGILVDLGDPAPPSGYPLYLLGLRPQRMPLLSLSQNAREPYRVWLSCEIAGLVGRTT